MMRKLPSLKSLRAFEAVARNKSFRKAADELCVSHSAISHQIKLLEEELGVFLFRRKGRSITLTKEGTLLYPVVNESFDNISDAIMAISDSSRAKTLTVQTYVTFGTVWLIPKLNDFQVKYPDIRVRISISFVDVDFDKDDADVGIIMGEKSWSHWEYGYLFDMDLFPVCSPQLIKSSKLKQPKQLKNHNLINIELAPGDWAIWLEAAGLDANLCKDGSSVDNYLQALEMIYDNKGLVMAREAFAKRDLEKGIIVRPFELTVPEPGSWYYVYPKEQNVKKEVLLFQQWLLEEVKKDSSLISGRDS